MAKWNLKLSISKELKELQNFTQNMKFLSYESEIKEVTEDDGTFEDLERELEDFVISFDVDNANYCMENIYQICDYAGILLVQG